MKKIHVDLETYSSRDLAKCGVYKYVEAPDYEILLFGYSVDDGPVQVVDLAQGEDLPEEVLRALEDDTVIKYAHNANFERVNLSRYLNYPTGEYLNPESWRCTMTWAAYLGLPLSLAGVGAVLGLDKQKLTEGKELIRYFCVPCAATKSNGGRTRNRPADAPEKWELFKKYNKRDVEVEMEIERKLLKFPVPENIWEEYHIDQEINDRGVGLDMVLVESAIKMDGEVREELKSRMKKITELENPNSVQQLTQWLGNNGLEIESLGKKQVKNMIAETDGEIKEVLQLRQQLAKSSVKKYQAMENAVCEDGRARGMFMFYGAMRTGRFSGRLIQMQNLVRNDMEDLDEARALVRQGNMEAVEMLYNDIPNTLSQLIRTAFIPSPGMLFYVADFSAIEARVLSWLAGEQWRCDLFESGGDIYCQSASQMFKVPVVKHGINGELRAKGKISELACIAEGQLVLTSRGLIPIENVTLEDKLWDGEEWVSHKGVVYKGEREVITYEGLTATPDHLVFVEGESSPVCFSYAARSGAHLVQTGDGRREIWLGQNSESGIQMGYGLPLLCRSSMHRMREDQMDRLLWAEARETEALSCLLEGTAMVKVPVEGSKTSLHQPKRSGVQQLRWQRDKVLFSKCEGSSSVGRQEFRCSRQEFGDGQDRYERELRTWQYQIHSEIGKCQKQTEYGSVEIRAGILAIRAACSNSEIGCWYDERRDNRGCRECCNGASGGLEINRGKVRVYDIRNAGRHHRFTVSNCLVHNCGYGGAAGALISMGALDMGLKEDELKPLVDAWRAANPNIVKLWWDVDRAAKKAVFEKSVEKVRGISFSYQSGFLFITLPSGRQLAYVKPRKGLNKFDEDCITYEGVGGTKKWERLETYGPKLVENIVQAISRDILLYAMRTLRCCRICMHIHDELVIEGGKDMSLEAVCEQMGRTPPWAPGLKLRADGYVTPWYKKD